MKILCVNKYFFVKGGAETVFFETSKLLEKKGHKIIYFAMKHPLNISSIYDKYFVSNIDYEKGGFLNNLKAACNLIYSIEAKRKMEILIKEEKPDIAHLHNIYHQLSPSILYALKKNKIPVVLTLHDYKSVCASYLMFHGGKICEACKNGMYYNCFLKGCVKNSRAKSLLNTIEMYFHHNILHIYDLVDIFISPSIFVKNKLKEMGFRGRVVHVPNFLNIEEYIPRFDHEENSIIYFGRLSEEKGLTVLIEAIKGLSINLKIIGEGPVREKLRNKVENENIANVKIFGYKTGDDLKNEIRKSMFVVLPSEVYENNPRTLIEGFALGKPAIGARIGGIPELIKDNETGLMFESGGAADLRSKIKYLSDNHAKIIEMGRNARKFVEQELNPGKYYEKLMEIYNTALEKR